MGEANTKTSTFLLTPIDIHAPDWETSTRRDAVQVEAADEDAARRRATLFYLIAARHHPGGRTLFSPWEQPQLVEATRLEAPQQGTTLIQLTDKPV